ncbi:MAG TPA: hypothetical protein VJB82_02245 [Candidatus Peribacterales bacterium]|nr:hypothetical protein [Candidatus Peribacterales bacterium]
MKHSSLLFIGMLFASFLLSAPVNTLASGPAYKQPIRVDGYGNPNMPSRILHNRSQAFHSMPITSSEGRHVPRKASRASARSVSQASKESKSIGRAAREKRLNALGIPQGSRIRTQSEAN